MPKFITTFCFLLSAFCSFSQSIINGQLLVQLKTGKDIEALTRSFQTFEGSNTLLSAKKFISPPMNIWLVEYNYSGINQKHFLNEVKFHPAVEQAQFNHIITYRSTTPDDAQFSQQWQYINTGQGGGTIGADIDADLAWDITTGGVTAFGDTIVVCVVDDGLSGSHPDFAGNKWFNFDEIPNNNIDDDGNGYEDDYRGWNADDNNDDITGGTFGGGHGTSVAGIVGAKGNNGIGVTGVNWNVKLMIVVGGGNEAQAVEAYTYPFVMRKRYNQSNGAEGAFVVATNSSWGIDGGDPADAPLWCAMYDSLGAYGILSAGATANQNSNIDVVGDLPTACPSDWLISVTNTNNDDVKVNQAGYGLTTIDLGAPGEDAHTASYPNGYSGFGGTSGATPHVAGTIGLLYSVQCASFMSLAYADPAEAALQIKQYILDGVDPNASLNNITVTGGRLNVFGAVNELLNNCSAGGCVTPFTLNAGAITDTSASFSWNGIPGTAGYDLRYKPTTAGVWTELAGATSPLDVTTLTPCTEFEFQVIALCDSDSSAWSPSFIFTTDGCCLAPDLLSVSDLTDTSATLDWNDLLAANSYNLELRPVGASSWTVYEGITANTLDVTGLEPCKEYEFRVQTVCDTGLTEFSAIVTFTTMGCGACTDLPYCDSKGEDASEEWIGGVELGQIDNNTGSDGGYGDYTSESTILGRNQTYYITLTPDFPGQAYNEVFRVWIDYNQNGNFGDAGENVYASGTTTSSITGSFTVPQTAALGSTRMRVSMRFNSAPQQCQNPFNYGEVEDYCVEIVEHDSTNNSIYSSGPLMNVLVYPNPFSETTVIEFSNPEHKLFHLEILDMQGKTLQSYSDITGERVVIEKKNLNAGVYFFELIDYNRIVKARGKLLLNK